MQAKPDENLFRLLMARCDWCLCGLCGQTAGKPTPNGMAAWAEGALACLPLGLHPALHSLELKKGGGSVRVVKSQGAWSALLVCAPSCLAASTPLPVG